MPEISILLTKNFNGDTNRDRVKAIVHNTDHKWHKKTGCTVESKVHKGKKYTLVNFTVDSQESKLDNDYRMEFVPLVGYIEDNRFRLSDFLTVRVSGFGEGPGDGSSKTVVYDDPDDPDTLPPTGN